MSQQPGRKQDVAQARYGCENIMSKNWAICKHLFLKFVFRSRHSFQYCPDSPKARFDFLNKIRFTKGTVSQNGFKHMMCKFDLDYYLPKQNRIWWVQNLFSKYNI